MSATTEVVHMTILNKTSIAAARITADLVGGGSAIVVGSH
jgi:hypothetical protein